MDRFDFDESLPPKQNCTGTFTENRSFGWFVKRLDRRRGTEEPPFLIGVAKQPVGFLGTDDQAVVQFVVGQQILSHSDGR